MSKGNRVGGLVAIPGPGVINSYWDTQTSGQTVSSGGIGKTTQQMRQEQTYVNWDFDTVWDIEEGVSYPWLKQ